MSKRLAIIQSNYIPWKGYFDIINMADEFVLYDGVQFTKNDWRNRNKIKTQSGTQWLTIPVKHNFGQKIKDTVVLNDQWRQKHWNSLMTNYNKSKYFSHYKEQFCELYLNSHEKYLSEINHQFILLINNVLGINTKITQEFDVNNNINETERLIELCKRVGADEYISGPSAKNYLNENLFAEENIKITWMDYAGYPEYSQLFPPFEHAVSIIDLIFNEGPNVNKFLKSFIS